MNVIVDRLHAEALGTSARPRIPLAALGRHALATGVLVGSVVLAVVLRFLAFAPASLRDVPGS